MSESVLLVCLEMIGAVLAASIFVIDSVRYEVAPARRVITARNPR
jgi:hypothetical protein